MRGLPYRSAAWVYIGGSYIGSLGEHGGYELQFAGTLWTMAEGISVPVFRFIAQMLVIVLALLCLPGYVAWGLFWLGILFVAKPLYLVVERAIDMAVAGVYAPVIAILFLGAFVATGIYSYRDPICEALMWILMILRWLFGVDRRDRDTRITSIVLSASGTGVPMKEKRLELEINGEGTITDLFENVTKRITAKSQAKTYKETSAALRSQNELARELNENIDLRTELSNAGTRSETKTYQHRANLMRAEDELVTLEDARTKRTEKPVQSEADRIRAENERIKAEMEQLQLRLEQEKLKARVHDISAHRKEPPKPEGFAEKVAREFGEFEKAKMTLLATAEKLALEMPAMKEQIMRDAQKEIEALRDRRRQ
jgi:hypothetical protein